LLVLWLRLDINFPEILILICIFSMFAYLTVLSLLSSALGQLATLEELSFNEDGRLNSHWVLYSRDKCEHNHRFIGALNKGVNTNHRHIASITGDLEQLLLGAKSEAHTTSSAANQCSAVMLTRGQAREHISHAIPEHTFHMTIDAEDSTNKGAVKGYTGLGSASMKEMSLDKWIYESDKAEIGWISYHPGVADVFWINDDNEYIKSGTLKYGERNTVWLQSRIGHRFEIVGQTDKKVWWTNWHYVEGDEYKGTEAPEGVRLTVAGYNDVGVMHDSIHIIGDPGSGVDPKMNNTNAIRQTLDHEWERSRRIKRTFTEVGFGKARLPIDLFQSISTYYYNNRMNKVREEWDKKGVYVNHWQADVFLIGMPWDLKRYWQSRLMPMVENWIGGTIPLELSDIYGMRRYEDGASLLPHVDREETHAVSMIVNIAQGGLNDHWPVEIYDHGDRLHLITMEPGDVVFYESAKALHSRVDPLQGGYYVNLFTHYRPIGDSQWFSKPNNPETPKPLLDVGQCSVPEGATRVACDKHPSGRGLETMALSLETVSSGDDMFKRWQRLMRNHPKTINAVHNGPLETAPAPDPRVVLPEDGLRSEL
jgi:hypothetical protein